MDKILTVVVPTYNMEKYLAYCLDSLCVNQGQDNLEVLIVNDGSKDASSAIAHEYETRFPQIFKVIDKENGNYGSCVNRGLAEAHGKYIKILDADDSFDTVNFERFIAFLKETDTDLILSDFAVVDTGRKIRKIIRYKLGEGTRFEMDKVCSTHVFKEMQMHAVTYRRENLLRLNYKQTEGISYTDQQWIFIPMIVVKSVAYFGAYVYKYLVGRAGQTMDSKVRFKYISNIQRCALDMAKAYEQYKSLFEKKAVQTYLQARMIPFVKEVYVFLLTHYNETMKNLLTDFDQDLKEASKDIYELIGSKEVSSFRGFEYITYWRNHKDVNKSAVKFFSQAYLLLLRMKQIRKSEDEMALPSIF